MMTMYRWYYDEEWKHSISGVVLAENLDDAVEETKAYLRDQFDDINGEMNFIVSEDESRLDEYNRGITLWVWECDTDDDFHDNNPNCIAVSY